MFYLVYVCLGEFCSTRDQGIYSLYIIYDLIVKSCTDNNNLNFSYGVI